MNFDQKTTLLNLIEDYKEAWGNYNYYTDKNRATMEFDKAAQAYEKIVDFLSSCLPTGGVDLNKEGK